MSEHRKRKSNAARERGIELLEFLPSIGVKAPQVPVEPQWRILFDVSMDAFYARLLVNGQEHLFGPYQSLHEARQRHDLEAVRYLGLRQGSRIAFDGHLMQPHRLDPALRQLYYLGHPEEGDKTPTAKRKQASREQAPMGSSSASSATASAPSPAAAAAAPVAADVCEDLNDETMEETEEKDFDVIVIGAGTSGLVAARECVAAGLTVGIFESRNEPGGRLRTHTLRHTSSSSAAASSAQPPHSGDVHVELGAQYIHGCAGEQQHKGNPVLRASITQERRVGYVAGPEGTSEPCDTAMFFDTKSGHPVASYDVARVDMVMKAMTEEVRYEVRLACNPCAAHPYWQATPVSHLRTIHDLALHAKAAGAKRRGDISNRWRDHQLWLEHEATIESYLDTIFPDRHEILSPSTQPPSPTFSPARTGDSASSKSKKKDGESEAAETQEGVWPPPVKSDRIRRSVRVRRGTEGSEDGRGGGSKHVEDLESASRRLLPKVLKRLGLQGHWTDLHDQMLAKAKARTWMMCCSPCDLDLQYEHYLDTIKWSDQDGWQWEEHMSPKDDDAFRHEYLDMSRGEGDTWLHDARLAPSIDDLLSAHDKRLVSTGRKDFESKRAADQHRRVAKPTPVNLTKADWIVLEGYRQMVIDPLIQHHCTTATVPDGREVDGQLAVVHYRCPVASIEHRTDCRLVRADGVAEGAEGFMEVRLAEGADAARKVYRSLYVVATLPLGILKASLSCHRDQAKIDASDTLKKNLVTFVPPLSSAKQEVITTLGFGIHNKVLLRFDTHIGKGSLRPPKPSGTRSGDAQGQGEGAGDTALHPLWSEFGGVPNWTNTQPDYPVQILNLHAYGKPGTLCMHVYPPLSDGFNGKDDQQALEECLGVLENMFRGPLKPRLCEGAPVLPTLLDWKITHWEREPEALGSYSYLAKGCGEEAVTELGQPEHSGRLQFAGEATSREGFQCVTGAWMSGERAAKHIRNHIRDTNPNHPMVSTSAAGGTGSASMVAGGEQQRARRPSLKRKENEELLADIKDKKLRFE